MAFWVKTSRYYADQDDFHSGLRILCDRIAEFELKQDEGVELTSNEISDYWMDVGAAYTLEILETTNGRIDTGERFVKLFDQHKKGLDYGLSE